MTPSLHLSLYEEHFDECSALYERRLQGFDDPEVSLFAIGQLEARFEAHFDALLVGAEQAFEYTQAQTASCDWSALYAGTRLGCRLGHAPATVTAAFDRLRADYEEDPEAAHEVARALAHALGAEACAPYTNVLVDMLEDACPVVAHVAATVAARHRVDHLAEHVMRAYQRHLGGAVAPFLSSLASLAPADARPLLYEHVQGEAFAEGMAAAIALLRQGDDQLPNYLRRCIGIRSWAPVPAALAAGSSCVPLLIEVGAQEAHRDQAAKALGFLGTPPAYAALLGWLSAGVATRECTQSLALMTGVCPLEEAPVRFSSDDGESEETDDAEWGTDTRLSHSAPDWPPPWHERGEPTANLAWRMGRPLAPPAIVAALRANAPGYNIRCLLIDELRIRYGLEAGFFADDSAHFQAAHEPADLASASHAPEGTLCWKAQATT